MLNTHSHQQKKLPKISPLSYLSLFFFLLIEISILIWTAYDHSIPCWDTAAHKVNSYFVFDLLSHPHIRQMSWYRSIFSVSELYPPLLYIISALLKFTFGQTANTELIANLFFVGLLFYSLYYITKITYGSDFSALIAAILVFLYPGIYWSSHCASLDFAANAMVAVGLAVFFWWAQYPHIKRSLLLGLVLGLATLTKNNAPIFFVGPILVDIFYALKYSNTGKPDLKRIGQLLLVACTSLLVILPWLFLAGSAVSEFILSIQQQNFSASSYGHYTAPINASHQFTALSEFLTHLNWFTLEDLPIILSPLLCGCFVISIALMLLTRTRPLSKSTIYLLSSIIFSLLIASAFRWPHQFRYIVPASIPMAALSAGILAQLWLSGRILFRILLILLAFISLNQFLYTAFNPYPLNLPPLLDTIALSSGSNFKEKITIGQMPGVSITPLPNSDTGILWSLCQIESASAGKPTSVMVMPSGNPINSSPYFYLARARKDNIDVASPRQHTETGDKVSFNQIQAAWYKWYILKSGDQGISLYDNESALAYAKWLQFVHHSGLYKLVNKKQLPDNSTLELYGPIKK